MNSTLPTLAPSPDLAAQYERWNRPGSSEDRAAQTRRLAAQLLDAPLATRMPDGMIAVTAGWDLAAGQRADAAGKPGSAEWLAALGRHDRVLLTADGRGCTPERWCTDPNGAQEWVAYERWTAEGRAAHGFVCGDCRKLLQSG